MMHGGVRVYNFEVPTMIAIELGNGNVNLYYPTHMCNYHLPVPRGSIWSYMIWMVKTRTRLLAIDATPSRVTHCLAVDVGEAFISACLGLGATYCSASYSSSCPSIWPCVVCLVWPLIRDLACLVAIV